MLPQVRIKGGIRENYSFLTYVVALQCVRNHFISEKYKTVQSFKLISFRIAPMCNYILLPAPVKVIETFLEATAWNTFQLLRRIINDASSIIKATSFQCWFQSREQVTISWSQARGSSGIVTLFFAKKSLTNADLCFGTLSWRETTVVSPFFGEFPSDRIPKAKKDIKVHSFIHSSDSCKLYHGILGNLWS